MNQAKNSAISLDAEDKTWKDMPKSQDVLVLLRQIIRVTDMHDKQLSRITGLTMPQLMTMQTLDAEGAITIGVLAKKMNLAQATVTSILDRLELKGLVRRERSQTDKRKVLACPTPSGIELLKSAPTTLQDRFVGQFEGLKDWEQSMIIASLQQISGLLEADQIDAAPMLDIGALDRPIQ
ncbi:transcriptional regulator, MarR family [Marinobacterium lutimaris]|uniref:Transcriptional regulator, MarR family n=2 Tax=Marinobacterium lutimaris TaxID=568106 RepID=A0A1H5UHF0_9GAMM|nr:transcriptional regulator, MarR family [Marinobacterium lutimaris]